MSTINSDAMESKYDANASAADTAEQAEENAAAIKREQPLPLTKGDLIWTMFFLFAYVRGAAGNIRRGGIAFGAAMARVLKKLYRNEDDLREALKRNTEFYMTEYCTGEAIGGFVVSLEEQRAKELADNGESQITPDFIRSIKARLMGPFAGFGDTLIQGVIHATFIGLAIPLCMQGNPAGLWLLIFGITWIDWFFAVPIFFGAYRGGKASIQKVLHGTSAKRILDVANMLGMAMMGAMTCSYVKFSTAINLGSSTLDQVIETIIPGFYPLAIVFAIYALMKKNVGFLKIIFGMMIIFIILAMLHVFG